MARKNGREKSELPPGLLKNLAGWPAHAELVMANASGSGNIGLVSLGNASVPLTSLTTEGGPGGRAGGTAHSFHSQRSR